MELSKSNYRSVSNLPYISKLVKKAMLEQINLHCNAHSFLPDYQSAYRENRSYETVLLKLTNGLLWSMERKNVTAMITLDLSSAFDTVDHKVLLTTLQSNFGIKGMALKWFQNYLVLRDMTVKIGKSYLERKELTFLVPQGSCSGAYLFNMYSSTISEEVDPGLSLIAFADDHAIIQEFNPNQTTDESHVINLLADNLTKIKEWMNSVRLKMNNSKSEFIIFGNRIQAHKCDTSELNIDEVAGHKSQIVKYLDAWLDSGLT